MKFLRSSILQAGFGVLAVLGVFSLESHGQTLANFNVDQLIASPPSHTGGGAGAVTDASFSTGWTFFGGSSITLGWNNGIVANGSGDVEVFSEPNLYPWSPESGMTARLLLSDGSYTTSVVKSYTNAQLVLNPVDRIYYSRMTFDLGAMYTGPLSILGIQLGNITANNDGNGVITLTSYDLRLVRAVNVEAVPEPGSAVMILIAAGASLFRKRRPVN